MSTKRRERMIFIAVVGGILFLLCFFLLFTVLLVKNIGVLGIHIYSFSAAFWFIVGVFMNMLILAPIGTFLETVVEWMFKGTGKRAFLILAAFFQFSLFGLGVYVLDRWIEGVSFDSLTAQIVVTATLYGSAILLEKVGERIKEHDEKRKDKPQT